jgi:hypothetical protein
MNLVKIREITVTRNEHIEAAMLMASLSHYLYKEPDSGGQHLSHRIRTSFDRLLGGALFYAIAVAQVLDELVDWEQWDDGVFSYEYIEFGEGDKSSDKNLATYILNETSDDDWYQIAENYMLPARDEIVTMLRKWAAETGVPVKA